MVQEAATCLMIAEISSLKGNIIPSHILGEKRIKLSNFYILYIGLLT